MDGIGEIIGLLMPYIGPLVIATAVFAYLLAQYYQRKIFPRVEYHRKGPNAETYPCVEIGNRVMLRPAEVSDFSEAQSRTRFQR